MSSKKIYFASDFHLGVDAAYTSGEREQQVIRWLREIARDASAIYLVGDIFDYWFEYKEVVPRGYIRFLAALRDIRDKGIALHIFTGNHDMWMFDYLENFLDIKIYRKALLKEIGKHTFFIGHGDGLGPGDWGYKCIKAIFSNPISQYLYSCLHPNFALWLMRVSSAKSRESEAQIPPFGGAEKEWLCVFANDYLKEKEVDYFIFGHRHLTIDYMLNNGKSRYINLGEWLYNRSYAVYDGEKLEIRFFENENPNPVIKN